MNANCGPVVVFTLKVFVPNSRMTAALPSVPAWMRIGWPVSLVHLLSIVGTHKVASRPIG